MFLIIILLIVCCFVSAMVQRISGFGLATLLMPLLLLFMDFKEALLITGVVCFLGSVVLSVQNRKHIQWKTVLIPVVPYAVIAFFITRFMATNSVAGLRRWLGLFLFVLAIYLIVTSKKTCKSDSTKTGLIVGGITGVTHTLFNVAGPPMAIYYLGACKSNLAYLTTMQVFLCIIGVYSNAIRLANGMFYKEIIPLLILGMAGVLIGFWVGGKLFDRLNPEKMKKVVYAVVAASGLWLFIGDVLGVAG